jgi:hypothetical protein
VRGFWTPGGKSISWADVIGGTQFDQMKGANNETSYPFPEPTAPTAQLQARPCYSNSPGEGAVCFPPGAIRNQTKDYNHRLNQQNLERRYQGAPLEPISVL